MNMMLRKLNKKKILNDGHEIIEYLYECPKCKAEYWTSSKELYMRCASCAMKGIKAMMGLAL